MQQFNRLRSEQVPQVTITENGNLSKRQNFEQLQYYTLILSSCSKNKNETCKTVTRANFDLVLTKHHRACLKKHVGWLYYIFATFSIAEIEQFVFVCLTICSRKNTSSVIYRWYACCNVISWRKNVNWQNKSYVKENLQFDFWP